MEQSKEINVYNLILLDESGSMSSIWRQALDGINETLNGIRKTQDEYPSQHQYVSIVTFEGNGVRGVKTLRDRIPVENIQNLKDDDYRPGGCTPLYDAMGLSLNYLQHCVRDEDVVLVTIITDGYENSSNEYSGQAIKTLVEKLRGRGWTFAYIGANQDAVEVAKGLNIDNAMNFDATPQGTVMMCLDYESARRDFSRQVDQMAKSRKTKSVKGFFKKYALFNHHEGAVKSDALGRSGGSADVVVLCNAVTDHIQESLLDFGDFFVDGIVKRIGQSVNAASHCLHILPSAYGGVDVKQLQFVICKLFETNTFRMLQIEEIHSLVESIHLHFHSVKVIKEQPVLPADSESAQGDLIVQRLLNLFKCNSQILLQSFYLPENQLCPRGDIKLFDRTVLNILSNYLSLSLSLSLKGFHSNPFGGHFWRRYGIKCNAGEARQGYLTRVLLSREQITECLRRNLL